MTYKQSSKVNTYQHKMSDTLRTKFSKNRIDNIQSDYNRISFESVDDKLKFISIFDDLITGNSIPYDDSGFVSKYARIGDSQNSLKIYFASVQPGMFGQTSREKVFDITDKNGLLKKEMLQLGMMITSSTTIDGGCKPKIASKEINPSKLVDGRTYKPSIKINRNINGAINEIVIDSISLKLIKSPEYDDLYNAFKFHNPKLDNDEIRKMTNRMNRAIERYNKSLDKWENLKDIEFLETIPGLNKLDAHDRLKKISIEYPMLIANKILLLLGPNPTERELHIVELIKEMSTIEDPEEFNEASINVLRKMDDIEALRKGSADLAESLVYVYMNKKGFRAELPAGENFPVADIICLDFIDDTSDIKDSTYDYAEHIAIKGLPLAINLETLGGISVKKDGGAASALKNKINESLFKHNETSTMLKLLADNHNNFLGTIDKPTTPETINEGQLLLDEVERWAIACGIINQDDIPYKYGKRSTAEWAFDTVRKWESDGYGPFPEWQVSALTQHIRASLLIGEIHNNDLLEQSYGNINVSTAKDSPGMHITDGITTASLMKMSPNPGFKFLKGKGYNDTTIPRPNAIYSANLIHAEFDVNTNTFRINK